MSKNLKIINARENNLKNISLEIPHDCLTVVTGLSGSGKSSLAFDTVYAEGQRRYLETFNSYTRQFFDLVKRPDADLIQNVRPAIAIEQKTKIRSSRSTVGSVSGINDFLKVVWNFLAEPVCPKCDVKIDLTTAKEAAIRLENILKYNDSSVFVIIAAIKLPEEEKSKTKKNPKIAEVERLKVLGVTRCLNTETGEIFELDSLDKPSLKKLSVINLVIERVKHNSHSQLALSRAIEKAYSLATNRCLLIEQSANLDKSRRSLLRIINSPSQQNIKTTNRRIFEFRLIPDCTFEDVSLKSKRPSLFSYNHPYGACEECRGFGSILIVTSELCVPDLSKSISNGALHCWSGDSASGQLKKLIHFCDKHQINIDIPWKKLDQSHKDLIFNHNTSEYRGVLAWFKGLERKLYKTHVRIFISRFRKEIPCPSCLGKRLNKSALSYRIQTLNITEINSQPISDLLPWIEELQTHTKKLPKQIENIFEEVLSRLHYLNEVGLSYLTLNRQSNTLSGGETQRVNLAAAIGSNLTSTQFVLDEPTVGLHPRDTHRLIKAVQQLKDKGNSILVVEHDLDFIDSADNIIEIGPQAGNKGGEVIYSGPKNEWKPIALDKIPLVNFFEQESSKFISIKNANTRNLKDISLKIPLGKLIALTGVSGSGKSTILKEVILKGYEELKSDRKLSSASSIEGFSEIGEVVLVDQSAISRTPRGNIATYIGIWDEVRNLFAATEEAQTRRLSKSSFSFNVDAGRCTACKGAGFIREDMQFLSDVYIPCDTCLGKRFQQIVLEVTFQSKSIADILELSIEETGTFFKNSKAISRAVETLCSLGLGYLRLGHPLSELSGGEAQRLKLVSFITGNNSKKSLLLFDEPTTGLHVNDVVRLVTLFRNLIESGHSILCVEHNLTLIEACDWLIDMGPEGGEGGGRILFEGLPNKLSTTPQISYTAKYLNLHQNRFNSKLKKVSEKTNKKELRKNQELEIRGAREHNLRNIDLSVPLNELVAFTGVSGSGKSSIAKDIIYAEGQRSYLDCLSPYARQFIKELKQPDIDSISGVPPTICVYQHTFQPGFNSTVGTMSEIYNYLRLLYSKIGLQYCPDHTDEVISPMSAADICEDILSKSATQIKILAPVIKGKKGLHKGIFERAQQLEITSVRVDGKFSNPSKLLQGLEKSKQHTIEYVLASFSKKNATKDLVEEVVNQSLSIGSGSVIVILDQEENIYSTERTCPICHRGFLKPDPEDLSFSSRRGKCLSCEGSGFVNEKTCTDCKGSRLAELGRNLRIKKQSIHDLSLLKLKVLSQFLANLKLSSREKSLSEHIISEVQTRIRLMIDFGLEYLPLARSCRTLSGGELQRLRLATALGANLSGVMYILDEPSSGLHPFDNRKVIAKLSELKSLGNSLLVIEHDPETILSTNHVIDVGPGGGKHGGNIIYQGPTAGLLNCKESITGNFLKKNKLPNISIQSPLKSHDKIKVTGSLNNIDNINIDFPLNSLICVAGVSGAGKSTLVQGMLAQTMLEGNKKELTWKRNNVTVESTTHISNIFVIDQKPLGKNIRSIPASYLGIWDEIRKVFAMTPEAKARGWTDSFFSFNSGKGRCTECKGLGEIVLEMNFLPTAKIPCEKCRGMRYTDEALTVKYTDLSMADILAMTIEEAKFVFANHKKIHKVLSTANDLGIGYISLGQSTGTLSGGEAQRVKLALELARPKKDNAIYILDEPTAGLHIADVSKLVSALKNLVEHGHTVIVIEHDEMVIKNSHHIIELGPDAGEGGGQITFNGNYESLTKSKSSWGELLRQKKSSLDYSNSHSSEVIKNLY